MIKGAIIHAYFVYNITYTQNHVMGVASIINCQGTLRLELILYIQQWENFTLRK
jgi:hypothetical protein